MSADNILQRLIAEATGLSSTDADVIKAAERVYLYLEREIVAIRYVISQNRERVSDPDA